MEPIKTPIAKTVEDYLNELSYEELNQYVPSEFALNMVNIIKLIEGGSPENKTPVVHFKFIDTLIQQGHAINMCHRGFAKTTVKEYLLWYIAIFGELPGMGRIPYALYVSDSMDNGVKKMRRSMEGRWQQSSFLQKYVPKAKFTDTIWDFTNASGNRFVVTGHGAQTGVRGTRENNSRPVLALLDDLISDTDAKSPTVIENVEATIYNAIFAALHPDNRKIIWSGTPFNAGDPLYKAVESGAWNVNVFPVCEHFPCTREEFRGSWEDRFTYDSVLESYNLLSGSGNLEAFNQELMLRIMSEDDKVIRDGDIQWYDKSALLARKSSYNFYITTDFATSEKTSADFSVISVWALNNKGQWFWVDGICKRQLMDKNVDDLFRLVQIYSPLSVGIEVTGQQGGFIPLIRQEMLTRNIFFNFASQGNNNNPGIRPNNQKYTRFLTVLPWFKAQMMHFPIQDKNGDAMSEAMNELNLVSKHGFKSKHDDFIDTISMLSLMNAWRPSEESTFSYNPQNNIWEEDSEDEEESAYNSYLV
ncbi:terminase large subunit [Vibrio phage BUCT194]|uniref:Terminase large subunit n=1 Tax=Vibrio phage BUCT194 TaxID=2859072 RepID=A0AAE8XFU1_9CAUD|nr:terminase large subunit [Vibrio phage BUCT194]UAW01163.1 terminase large subunit [Vibrio phage BUCT194]